MVIVTWWSSNPRIEYIGTVESVPLLCEMYHIISPAFLSCLYSPPASPPLHPSPSPCFTPPPPSQAHPIGQVTSVPTIPKKTRPPPSSPTSLRGPELVVSQSIAQPCSASLVCRPRSYQSPHTSLLTLQVDIPGLPPPVSMDVYP